MVEPFSLTSSALPSTTRVLAFRGTEALSALYELQVHVWIEDPTFDMAAALGADATFSIHREDEQPCAVHGILATLETVDDLERGAVYRVVLVPRLWQLTLTLHSRVFVGQTTPAILEAVLQGSGMQLTDYEIKLSGSYGPLEHVCQYRESNFAFLSRRMEREGIYYFFEQGESRERLVITDDKGFQQPLTSDPVRYYRVSGAGAGGVLGLRSFTCRQTTIPGSVILKDRDYLRPALDVSGVAPASDRTEEVHLYGENLVTPEDAARLANVRAEELKAGQVVFRGVGNTSLLRAGYAFTLQDHPRPGVDGEYMTREIVRTGHHFGGLVGAKELLGLAVEHDEVHRVEVVALPRSAQFRPARRTPVPRIYGTERAVVDGSADHDYAQLDEHGRYLVKIDFDESPAKNGKASTRIRMMQPHGGNPESFHFPLRKGTEVLLTFEGGDPDRPVIAGVVPNLVNPTGVTAANATRNILQTGGRNRFQIEDREGKQHVRFSTPHLNSFLHLGAPNDGHNWIGNTDGNTYSITGQDSETGVGGSRLTVIGDAQGTYTNSTGAVTTGNEMDPLLLGEALALANPTAGQGNTKDVAGGMDTVSSAAPVKAGTVTVTESGSGTPTSTINVPPAPGSGGTAGDVTGSGGSTGTTIQFADAPAAVGFSLNLSPTSATAMPPSTSFPHGMIATGLVQDPDSRPGYRPGSDIKILAGDNVTKGDHDNVSAYAGDQVSHVHGHVYSVVGMPPDGSVPAQPVPGSQPIKLTTVYGNVETHINGSQTSHIGNDAGQQHLTQILGNRVTEVTPSDTSMVGGFKTSLVGGANTKVVLGMDTSVLVGGEFKLVVAAGLKFTLGGATELNPTEKFDYKVLHTKIHDQTLESTLSSLTSCVDDNHANVTSLRSDVTRIDNAETAIRQAVTELQQTPTWVVSVEIAIFL